MATIELILGSMFSGKSTELMRRCRKYISINKKIILINSSLDSRCNSELKTHDNFRMDAVKAVNLSDICIQPDVDVIAIDEAQFFHDLYEFVLMNERKNIIILIAGLDGDFNRESFGDMWKCVPLANSVIKLTAMCGICKDGTPGIFSKRLSDSQDKVMVGACTEYVPVCRKHYFTPSSDVRSSYK